MSEAVIAAARGVAFLDRAYPEWWTRVDLGTLDLSRWWECVWGQLAGEEGVGASGYGRAYLGISGCSEVIEAERCMVAEKWMQRHGFTLGAVPVGEQVKSYEELTEAWCGEVKARAGGTLE